MYIEKYYTPFYLKTVVNSNTTINKFINKYIIKNKNDKLINAIIYGKYYCCYKNYNCCYDEKIMDIIFNTIKN